MNTLLRYLALLKRKLEEDYLGTLEFCSCAAPKEIIATVYSYQKTGARSEVVSVLFLNGHAVMSARHPSSPFTTEPLTQGLLTRAKACALLTAYYRRAKAARP